MISRTLRAAYWELTYAFANRKAFLLVAIAFLGSLLVALSTYSALVVGIQDIHNMIEISRDTSSPFMDMARNGDEMATGAIREVVSIRRAIGWSGLPHAALDLASFIIAPSLGAFLGHSVVSKWRTYGLVKQRSVEDGWREFAAGSQMAGVVLGALFVSALIVATVMVGLLLDVALDLPVIPGESLIPQQLPDLRPIVPKAVFCWLVFVVFYLVGLTLGQTSSSAFPLLLLIIVLWVVPIVSGIDPRSVMANAGRSVLDFEGGFALGSTVEPSVYGRLTTGIIIVCSILFPYVSIGSRSRYR